MLKFKMCPYHNVQMSISALMSNSIQCYAFSVISVYDHISALTLRLLVHCPSVRFSAVVSWLQMS